jgi:hypothetical protein
VLHEALDRAALAGRVAALEQDHQPLSAVLAPVLQLQQLDLQQPLLVVVVGPGHALVVRVVLAPGVHRAAVRVEQHRIVVIVVRDPVAAQLRDGPRVRLGGLLVVIVGVVLLVFLCRHSRSFLTSPASTPRSGQP